jgi:hypothetical protein
MLLKNWKISKKVDFVKKGRFCYGFVMLFVKVFYSEKSFDFGLL